MTETSAIAWIAELHEVGEPILSQIQHIEQTEKALRLHKSQLVQQIEKLWTRQEIAQAKAILARQTGVVA
jgi:hypothetical protein